MMDEAPADLRELVRLQDVVVVCSSRGWSDEKHLLYLQLLEETFVTKLHDGERGFKELFNLSPRYCRQVKSSKQVVEYAKPDQGCHGIVDADRVKSCMKVELMDSPCCGNQQDGKIRSTDDNASTTEPVEKAISQARTTSSGQSSTCHLGKHGHSPSRSAEGSDQNFDEETKGTGESRRGCSQKRLKSYNVMRDDLVLEGLVQKAGLIACDKHKDKYNGSSKVDAGTLDAEAGSPTCKNHGSKG